MSSHANSGAPTSGPARARILAVDDTPANLAALGILLEPLGHTVDLATCGKDALRMAQGKPYDLILLDLRMPMMDGLETARCLRRMGQEAPVLLMTAFEYPAEEMEALEDLVPIDVAAGLVRPELFSAKVKGWLALQLSIRTWKTLAGELALENDRLRGKVRTGS